MSQDTYIAGFCSLLCMLSRIQIYQFIRFGSTLFVFWVFSRIFSVQDVGRIEKILLTANFCTFFWLQAVQTHFLKKNAYSYNHYASFILLVSLCVGASILLYSLWNRIYVFSGLYVLFYPFGTLLEMYWIAQKNYKMLIRYSVVFYGIWVVAVSLTAYFLHSLFWVYAVWITIFLIRAVFCAVHIPFRFVKVERTFLGSLTWLMLTFLVAGSAEYIDGFLTDALFGKTELAQLRYGAREIPIFVIVANSLSLWITQNVAQSSVDNLNQVLREVKRKSSQYLIVGTIVSVVFMLISTPVYRYVYGEAYVSACVVFDIMLLLVVSRFIFSNSILLGLGLDKVQFIVTCIELAANVVFSLFGAYVWGIYGIAAATVIAYFAEKTMLAIYLHQKKQIHFTLYASLPLVVLCYLVFVCVLILKYKVL